MRSPFSKPLKRSAKPIKRSRLKRVNPKRRKSEFARCYHSKRRVAFVKNLPCIVCGLTACDNAHIETGGMGRKADYTKIVPLCCVPADHPFGPGYSRGHHGIYHHLGRDGFLAAYRSLGIDLESCAAQTEQAWIAFQGEKT